MSRAFTKEPDGQELDELPERPVSSHRNLVTPRGLQLIEERVRELRAAVSNARVALGYTIIRSPLDGRTGNLLVKAGNLVTANSSELMTIAQIQPAYVTFSVPAVHLPTIKQHMADAIANFCAPRIAGHDQRDIGSSQLLLK